MTYFINSILTTLLFIFLASLFFPKLCLAERVELKINLGGEAVDGFVAEQEVLDLDDSMAKMRYHGTIRGSGDDLNVFKTQRFSRGEDLVLNIPVADGVYTVTLLFAETWKGAFSSGKRVFDVYMGSKPTGIVKVCSEMDPFRSGGPASPVRRKFPGVATQGGLTVALRPIVQNPQIAGIIIDGYSYSNSLLEDLPTVPAAPGEQPDFSPLERVTAQTPADPSLIYDPSLNPKFKVEFKQSSGLFPSTSTASPSPPQQVSPTPGSPSILQIPSAQMPSNQATMTPSATNINAYGHPGVRGMGHPFGRGQAAQLPPSSNTLAPLMAAHAQSAALNPPSQGFSPLTALSVRPSAYYRRRLASFPPQGGYDAEKDMSSRFESMNPRPVQEQMEAPLAGSNFKPNLEGHNSRAYEGALQAPPTAYNNPTNYQVGGGENAGPMLGPQPAGLQHGAGINMGSPAAAGSRHVISNSPSEMQMSSSGAARDTAPEQTQYVNPTSRLSTQDGTSQRFNEAQAQTEAMRWEQGDGGYAKQERPAAPAPNGLQPNREMGGSGASWSSRSSPPGEAAPAQTGSGASPEGADGRPPETPLQYQDENSAAIRTQSGQDDKGSMIPGGIPNDPTSSAPTSEYMGRSRTDQPDYATQMNPAARASYSGPGEGAASGTMAMMGTEGGPSTRQGNPTGWNAGNLQHAGEYARMKDSTQDEQIGGNGGRITGMNVRAGDEGGSRGAESTTLGWGGGSGGQGGSNDGAFEQDGSGMGIVGPQAEQRTLPNTVHRTVMEDGVYGRSGAGFSGKQGYAASMDGMGGGNGFGSRMRHGGEGGLGREYGNVGGEGMDRRQRMQGGGGSGMPGMPGMGGLPDLVGMVDGDGQGGAEGGRVATPGVHNGMNRLDGMCIDNSTHCSCGMAERSGPVAEECLFVVNENTEPMICARRACSGRMVCACAAGANMLCKRSHVRSILVSAQVHRHDMVEEPNVVFCRREQIEQGVGVLTPIM